MRIGIIGAGMIGYPKAVDSAAGLARDAAFDPVSVGPLERGKEFEPNTRPYNTGMSGPELRTLFGQSR